MKRLGCLLIIFFSSYCKGQDFPQGLIYAAEIIDGGKSKYDLYSETGQKLFEKPVEWAYSNVWDWIFVVDRTANLTKAYNFKGTRLLIDSIESSKSVYLNLNRVAIKKNGKWGFYDKNGNLQIGHLYDEVSNFIDDLAAVKAKADTFLIDTNGLKAGKQNPGDKKYDFGDFEISFGMFDFTSPDFKVIKKNKRKGLANAQGKLLVPILYDEILSLKEHFQQVTVKKDDKYGVVSFSGIVIIPINYKSVFVLNDYLVQ